MRNAFAKYLEFFTKKNRNIFLLSGDIGNKLFDNYKKKFKKNFLNCGVAEANMTGVASGLAIMGFKPITYTITPFNTIRCFEQIKIDICYPRLPVVIVGTGSGLSYSSLGATHHSMDDIAILRTLPNINILCPADSYEVHESLKIALRSKNPTYIRLGKKGEPIIHKKIPNLSLGKSIIVKKGKDLTLLSIGNMLSTSLDCAYILEKNGVSAEVVNIFSLKPIDEKLLRKILNKKKNIVTIEEHGLVGGLSSTVSEFIVKNNYKENKIISFGSPNKFLSAYGNQQEARELIGLTSKKIAKQILLKIKK